MQKILDICFGTIVTLFFSILAAAAVLGALWLLWIFFSVIFLGDSSSCPQNLC